MASDAADLTVTEGPGWVLLSLSGEVDVSAVPGWQDAAAAALERRPASVVVDLTDVTFMDSSGLGVIATLVRGTRGTGATIYALSPRESIRRVIRICGLDHHLVVVDEDDPRRDELVALTDAAGRAAG